MPSRKTLHSGMTLIELMVAMVIFSLTLIFLMQTYSYFSQSSQAANLATVRNDIALQIKQSVDRPLFLRHSILNSNDQFNLNVPSLRVCFSGGAPLSASPKRCVAKLSSEAPPEIKHPLVLMTTSAFIQNPATGLLEPDPTKLIPLTGTEAIPLGYNQDGTSCTVVGASCVVRFQVSSSAQLICSTGADNCDFPAGIQIEYTIQPVGASSGLSPVTGKAFVGSDKIGLLADPPRSTVGAGTVGLQD